MKNYIHIENTKDDNGDQCLVLSLTIDGATELNRTGSLSTLNENDDTGFILSDTGTNIFKKHYVPYANPQWIKTDIYKLDKAVDIIHKWQEDPKKVFYFYPNAEDNKALQKEATKRQIADLWATGSEELVWETMINNQERFERLKKGLELIANIKDNFTGKNYRQNTIYLEKIDDVRVEMEKELEITREKMILIKNICPQYLQCDDAVNKIYKDFKGVLARKKENDQILDQAMGRIHRDGQNPTITVSDNEEV